MNMDHFPNLSACSRHMIPDIECATVKTIFCCNGAYYHVMNPSRKKGCQILQFIAISQKPHS